MGNSHQARRLQDDFDISALRGQSITFHNLHSDSIRLSNDNRVAKRVSSFRGICFSNRPICIGERLHLRISEATPSAQPVGRDGVLRVGLLSDDPSMLNTADLPTYACPDITYEQGYWAKAVPEHMARLGNVLFFYVTATGDVMYGLNGKEIGVFFGGVQTDMPLWALLDLYGTTCCVELLDGFQFGFSNSYSPSPVDMTWLPSTQPIIPNIAPFYPLPQSPYPGPPIIAPAWPNNATMSLPILHKSPNAGQAVLEVIDPMPFHLNSGRNVFFSMNRMAATRGQHDYCNGYVFTNRPLVPGERLVISIQAVTNEYSGGLAFGMTSCNPGGINDMLLPDDSDLLLDFPDYWVVHKDVYTKPEINDELSFHLTTSGEVRYAKNGHHVGTLMHVDTSLPMWAFFDIYGSTQQIKSLGVVTPMVTPLSSGAPATARNPPPISTSSRGPNFSSTVSAPNTHSVPSFDNPNRLADAFSTMSLADAPRQSRTTVDSVDASRRHSYADAPALPPKLSQNRSASVLARMSPPIMAPLSLNAVPKSATVAPTSSTVVPSSPLDLVMNVSEAPSSLPPPLIPMPGKAISSPKPIILSPKPVEQPARPRRRVAQPRRTSTVPAQTGASRTRGSHDPGGEASQECVVCMERSTDCALYMCGHMCMCYECAVDIVNNQTGLCPICREPIRDIIKIFRS